MKIDDFIIKNAEEILCEINKLGFVAGGKNGPYDDNETPFRISSHWILIFSWLYDYSHNMKWYNAAKTLAEYIYNSNNNYIYCCRNKEGKDHVNGTIGSAWIIEGLISAARLLNDDKYAILAEKMFLKHDFNYKIGLWSSYDIDGKFLGYDETFNHQLWHAASGALILEYRENTKIRNQITRFLDKCLRNDYFSIRKNGTVKHFLSVNDSCKHRLRFIKRNIKDCKNIILKKPNMIYKEEGYHYFAIYGFALLYNEFHTCDIFNTKKFRKALEYSLLKENYLRQLNINPKLDSTGLANKINLPINIYCFPYNSPSFEIPFIKKTFKSKCSKDEINELWEIQKKYTMNDKNELNKNVFDPKTLTARIYELLRGM